MAGARQFFWGLMFVGVLLLSPGFSAWAQEATPTPQEGLRALQSMELAFRHAIDQARPSVVSIFILHDDSGAGRRFNEFGEFGRPFGSSDPDNVKFRPSGYGSGVVVDARGMILTCYHVVRIAHVPKDRQPPMPEFRIAVRLADGRLYPAVIYAADPRSDLAVLRLVPPQGKLDLTPIPIADGDKLFAGQFVLTLGNPFGIAAKDGVTSASWGIVSNIRRRPAQPIFDTPEERTIHQSGTLIQTDARLNMGISGGALINIEGELVGITMALSADNRVEAAGGFAVPTDALTRRTIATLAEGREMEYGFLGIAPETITANEAAAAGYLPVAGAMVKQIYRFLPAARNGLSEGDIITSINGKPISDQNELVVAVGSLPAGEMIDAEIVRMQSRKTIRFPLAKYPVEGEIIVTNRRPAWKGIRVDHLSTLARQGLRFGTENSYRDGGVVVKEVDPKSEAYKKGLRENQIITRVSGQSVDTPDEFQTAIDKATSNSNEPVRLSIQDGDDIVFETNSSKADDKAK